MKKEQDAWFGIDSIHGRYQFGTEDGPREGIVAPKQMVTIVTRAWVLFKAERLFVGHTCASDFLLRAIFVGAERGPIVNADPILMDPFVVNFSDLANISAQMFEKEQPVKIVIERKGAEFFGAPFPLPTLLPGLDLSFQIEHIGNTPKRFLAAFLGKAIW
jgi:hypothetical protein